MMHQFPSAVLEATREASSTRSTAPSGAATPSLDVESLAAQLTTLGFRPAHVASALSALQAAYARLDSSSTSTSDPLVMSLAILSPLEAAIEWLLLHLPEDDLPPRYRTSASSSDFVTGASKDGGLVKGWMVDKLVKKAGFPRKAVERVLHDETRESVVLDILGRRLCGWEEDEEGWAVSEVADHPGDDMAQSERDAARNEELVVLEALLGERIRKTSASEYEIDIERPESTTSLILHVVMDEDSPYPSAQYPNRPPAFYISSETVPSYMRLHLHASLLQSFRDPDRGDLRSILESGAGGAVLSMVELLETALPEVIADPPDIGTVTQYLVPQVEEMTREVSDRTAMQRKKESKPVRLKPVTAKDHAAVKAARERMSQDAGYEKMMIERRRLPAWAEKDRITDALNKNRVLVVVGEVSDFESVGECRADADRLVVARGYFAGRLMDLSADNLTAHSSPSSSSTTRSALIEEPRPTSSSPSPVVSRPSESPLEWHRNGSKMWTIPEQWGTRSEVNGALARGQDCCSAPPGLCFGDLVQVIRISKE